MNKWENHFVSVNLVTAQVGDEKKDFLSPRSPLVIFQKTRGDMIKEMESAVDTSEGSFRTDMYYVVPRQKFFEVVESLPTRIRSGGYFMVLGVEQATPNYSKLCSLEHDHAFKRLNTAGVMERVLEETSDDVLILFYMGSGSLRATTAIDAVQMRGIFMVKNWSCHATETILRDYFGRE